MNLRPSALAAAALSVVLLVGAPTATASTGSRLDARPATATTEPIAPTDDSAPPVTVNDFLPEEENVGTCIGTLERPGCGSKAKGDFRQYLTFLALALGLGFIGWRITIAIRKRDREYTKPSGNTF